jgi:hypothetical protein
MAFGSRTGSHGSDADAPAIVKRHAHIHRSRADAAAEPPADALYLNVYFGDCKARY